MTYWSLKNPYFLLHCALISFRCGGGFPYRWFHQFDKKNFQHLKERQPWNRVYLFSLSWSICGHILRVVFIWYLLGYALLSYLRYVTVQRRFQSTTLNNAFLFNTFTEACLITRMKWCIRTNSASVLKMMNSLNSLRLRTPKTTTENNPGVILLGFYGPLTLLILSYIYKIIFNKELWFICDIPQIILYTDLNMSLALFYYSVLSIMSTPYIKCTQKINAAISYLEISNVTQWKIKQKHRTTMMGNPCEGMENISTHSFISHEHQTRTSDLTNRIVHHVQFYSITILDSYEVRKMLQQFMSYPMGLLFLKTICSIILKLFQIILFVKSEEYEEILFAIFNLCPLFSLLLFLTQIPSIITTEVGKF